MKTWKVVIIALVAFFVGMSSGILIEDVHYQNETRKIAKGALFGIDGKVFYAREVNVPLLKRISK